MGSNHLDFGAWGEKEACAYLESRGMRIITTRYRCNLGEIDIIAKDRDVVCFVEVKTRHGERFGKAYEAVGYHKQMKLVKLAQLYLLRTYKRVDIKSRFDVISILRSFEGKSEIIHLKNAFSLSEY